MHALRSGPRDLDVKQTIWVGWLAALGRRRDVHIRQVADAAARPDFLGLVVYVAERGVQNQKEDDRHDQHPRRKLELPRREPDGSSPGQRERDQVLSHD